MITLAYNRAELEYLYNFYTKYDLNDEDSEYSDEDLMFDEVREV